MIGQKRKPRETNTEDGTRKKKNKHAGERNEHRNKRENKNVELTSTRRMAGRIGSDRIGSEKKVAFSNHTGCGDGNMTDVVVMVVMMMMIMMMMTMAVIMAE